MGLIEENISWGSLNVGHFLKTSAAVYPKKIAILDAMNDDKIKYKELNKRVNSLSHGLMELGLKKGEFCVVLLKNRIEMAVTLFALSKIGSVIAPMPYRLLPGEMSELTNLCEATTFVFEQEFTEIIEAIRPKVKSVDKYVCVGREVPEYAVSFKSLLLDDTSEPQVEIFGEDYHALNFSSGTTGLPKGMVQNNFHNTYPLITTCIPAMGIDESDIYLNPFPLYGRVGWGGMFGIVYHGGTDIIMDFEPKLFLETVERQRPDTAELTTTMAEMLLLQTDLEQYDLSSLKQVIFIGSVLPLSTYNEVSLKICPNIREYFGSQEGNCTSWIRPEEKRKKPTSVGVPCTGVEVRIVKPGTLEDVEQGEVGEIIERGFNLIKEYFKNPEATKLAFEDGWFHMGDLGRFDEEGFLYILGRVKEMIITGGYNVFPIEVEAVLINHPKVQECTVIGLADKLWGEAVVGVVVSIPDEEVNELELIQFCKERLTGYKVPKYIKFVDSIPKNPTGKVLKKDLVKRFTKN